MRIAQIYRCERCGNEYVIQDGEQVTPIRASLCPTCIKNDAAQRNDQGVQGNYHVLDANHRCIKCGRQFQEIKRN